MSQYDKNTFESLYNDGSVGKPFQTNTSRAITEAIMRQFAKDISDSLLYGLTPPNTDVLYQVQDDMFATSLFNTSIGGSGNASSSTVGINSTENAIGVWTNIVSAVADYSSIIPTSFNSTILFGIGHTFIFRFRVNIGVLSTGTDRFKLNLGFGDVVSNADHANGAYFRYSDNINGGKYQCVTVAASVETVSDSGITPGATVFDVFQIQVDATGTNVYFSINGTIVQTHTTNIPVGAAQFVNWILKVYKTVGATARNIYTDWYSLQITRIAAR